MELFHRLFRKKADEWLQERLTELSRGAPEDFPSYKYMVGLIEGMRSALDLADQVAADINRGD